MSQAPTARKLDFWMRWWTSITNGSYDMELYINTYGSYIRKKDEMFEVSVEGKRQKLAPNKISSIVISNAATISTDAIQLAMEHNIDIVFLDQYGDPYGRIWFQNWQHCNHSQASA